ncbi:MAG: 50S ribosomal protein L15 [Actinobacteria bacterium HGW-Actinobacteria-4]|nr:MAG: 50S ribosomal protein L15 [Actinobacteria bacterium HGW-Actinobacteria-4]
MAEEKKPAAAKKPAAKKPAATSAAAEKKAPAAKKPAATKAAAEKKPAAKAAAPKAAAAKAPAATKAAATKPAAAKSTASKPAADKPAASKPAAAASAAKAPAKAPAAKAAADKPATKKAPAAKKKGSNGSDAGEKVSTLKMHHLRPAQGAHTKKTRVGRGEGSKGKTAGRGTKGTGARYQVPARFEGGQTPIHMRIPKLRGFRSPFKVYYQVVNLDQIAELFPKGGKITKEDLVAKGAVRKNRPVKVLGEGTFDIKITLVDADKVSQSAKTKIEAAGGSVNEH